MTRYEARPLPDHVRWGIWDHLGQVYVAWAEGSFEAMTRRAAKYNQAYEKVVSERDHLRGHNARS